MKTLCLIFLSLLISFSAQAFDVGIGISQASDKTQDTSGTDQVDPMSPTLSVGHTFDIWGANFAPRFGYTQANDNTNDEFGGGSKVETFYLLYDFLIPISYLEGLDLRLGFGTFRKTVKGDGGSITIPNGSGTMKAYKGETSKATSTLSWNLGLDYKFGWHGDWITDHGVRGELFILQPLDKNKRLFSLMLSYALFF